MTKTQTRMNVALGDIHLVGKKREALQIVEDIA